MEWLENFSKAIDYIEKNLDGYISYEAAAKIACCSTNYFQRMFAYVTGITLNEYIRRRKMTQASFELQLKDIKVLDVALKYGYTSPTAFNRAFKSVHGISPTRAKAEGCTLNSYPPLRFSIQIEGGSNMSYRIEEKAKMRMVGVRIPLLFDIDENYKSIPVFWEEAKKNGIVKEIIGLNNKLEKNIFGISLYTKNNEVYYYIATETDKPVPQGMYEFDIPETKWVVFENNGPFKESIQNTYKRFFMEWLPFSGYNHSEIADIEVYPFKSDDSSNGYSEIWMSIKKERK